MEDSTCKKCSRVFKPEIANNGEPTRYCEPCRAKRRETRKRNEKRRPSVWLQEKQTKRRQDEARKKRRRAERRLERAEALKQEQAREVEEAARLAAAREVVTAERQILAEKRTQRLAELADLKAAKATKAAAYRAENLERIEENAKHPGEKFCRSCRMYRPFAAFWKNKARKDGYQNDCKDCLLLNKSEKWSVRNPERVREVAAVKRATARLSKSELRRGHAYIVHAKGTPFFKVGKADDVFSRLASLQTGSPFELEVILWEPGGFVLESKLLELLDEKVGRYRGEWYNIEDFGALKATIEACIQEVHGQRQAA